MMEYSRHYVIETNANTMTEWQKGIYDELSYLGMLVVEQEKRSTKEANQINELRTKYNNNGIYALQEISPEQYIRFANERAMKHDELLGAMTGDTRSKLHSQR